MHLRPWQVRIRRAQALQLLGEIFQTEAASAKATAQEPGAIRFRLEVLCPGADGTAKAVLQEAMLGAMRHELSPRLLSASIA